MQIELVELQPKLEQAKIDNTKMMKVNSSSALPCATLQGQTETSCLSSPSTR